MTKEAKSGLFVFGIRHFLGKKELLNIVEVIQEKGGDMRQMCGRARVWPRVYFLGRATSWEYRHCRGQVSNLR